MESNAAAKGLTHKARLVDVQKAHEVAEEAGIIEGGKQGSRLIRSAETREIGDIHPVFACKRIDVVHPHICGAAKTVDENYVGPSSSQDPISCVKTAHVQIMVFGHLDKHRARPNRPRLIAKTISQV
jgi:hypothetical protein